MLLLSVPKRIMFCSRLHQLCFLFTAPRLDLSVVMSVPVQLDCREDFALAFGRRKDPLTVCELRCKQVGSP